MKLRFLHLSDLHLGSKNFYLAEKARDRCEDFKLAFRDAVEYALDSRHEIDGVLIAGNLFEYHRPSAELWSFVKGLLSRLLAKNQLVAMVPGHHDSFAYKNSVYRTERLPGVELFLNTAPEAPRVHEIRGTRVFVYGMSFVPGQTPTPLPPIAKVPEKGVHIALLNGHAHSHPDFRESAHELTLDLESLCVPGLDYLALGGYRGFREESIGETTCVYSGSLEGRGFESSDAGDKGPVIVEIEDGAVHIERLITNRKTIESVTIDLRAEKITDAMALKDAISTLSGRHRIVEVTLIGTAEFVADLDDIREGLEESFYHLEIRDESRLVDSALLRKIESENTIRGYFIRKLGERIETLKARIVKKGQTDELMRELRVHELAMKTGVEQFIEDEAPNDAIYSLIPDSDETVEPEPIKESVGVGDLEEKVKAMLEYRRRLNQADSSPPSELTAAPRDRSVSQNGNSDPSRNGKSGSPATEPDRNAPGREEASSTGLTGNEEGSL